MRALVCIVLALSMIIIGVQFAAADGSHGQKLSKISRPERPERLDGLERTERLMLLKIDTHSHTTLSDGKNTVEEMVAMAAKKKLDVLCITDHYAPPQPIPVWQEIALEKKYGVIIIFGTEIKEGNVDYVLLPFAGKYESSYTILAHPFIINANYMPKRNCDAVETNRNRVLEQYYAGNIELDASDMHVAKWLGRDHSIVAASSKDESAIISAIQQGKIGYGKEFWMKFRSKKNN
ncbi:MAG: PHP domain-containing protein [Methanotrichaceae archaeon]|nr:PHP domain-containing protein [Methanotrichaceae archaeon]